MDLEMNKYSKIVSKVKMITATIDNRFIKYRGTKFSLWPLLFGQGVRGDSMSPVKSITIEIQRRKGIIKDEYFLLFYYFYWIEFELFSQSLNLSTSKRDEK